MEPIEKIIAFPKTRGKRKKIVGHMPCPGCGEMGFIIMAKNETYTFSCQEKCKGGRVFGHFLVVRLMYRAYQENRDSLVLIGIDELMFLKEVQIVLNPPYPPSFHSPHFEIPTEEKIENVLRKNTR